MTDLGALYDLARRHGLSHDAALDALADGKVTCWCGSSDPCSGGAQRHVGCPHTFDGKPALWSEAPIPIRLRKDT